MTDSRETEVPEWALALVKAKRAREETRVQMRARRDHGLAARHRAREAASAARTAQHAPSGTQGPPEPQESAQGR